MPRRMTISVTIYNPLINRWLVYAYVWLACYVVGWFKDIGEAEAVSAIWTINGIKKRSFHHYCIVFVWVKFKKG